MGDSKTHFPLECDLRAYINQSFPPLRNATRENIQPALAEK